MPCNNCREIVAESCATEYCDGAVSTPCEIQLADRCIIVTSELTNIGACKEQVGNYECSDLNTVLEAIDSLMGECGVNCWTCEAESNFTYLTTDSVGIGTATPGFKLEVNGDFLAEDEPSAGVLYKVTSGELATNASLYDGTQGAALQVDNNGGTDSLFLVTPDNALMTVVNAAGSTAATVQADITSTNPGLTLLATKTGTSTTIALTSTNLSIDGNYGWTGTFTNGEGDTVTVTKGIITNVAP